MAEEKLVKAPNTPNDKGEIVVVSVLGNEIRLRTQASSVYIHKLTEDIENRIKRCMSDSGIMSSLKAVILVCLDLADELEKEKKQHSKKDKVWEERIDKLLNKISAV